MEKQFKQGASYITVQFKIRDTIKRRESGWKGRTEENEILNRIIVALYDADFSTYFIANFLNADRTNIRTKLKKYHAKYTKIKGHKKSKTLKKH